LNLHNSNGKRFRKFVAYFPIFHAGHTAKANLTLLLQGMLAMKKAMVIVESAKLVRVRFCSVVMDGDSSHRPMFTNLKSPLKLVDGQSYFECPFIRQKTFYLQDPEHLIKRFRNGLYKSLQDPTAVWFLHGGFISW
jgi:hypothetical protein